MIIRNAACALPGQTELLRRDIKITDGRIVSIASGIDAAAGEEIIEAEGLEAWPGAIDPHVHFDEPGFTHREDFLHGSMAAARGGVTTVIDMPCTSLPPVTSAANLKTKLAAMGTHSVVDFGLFGGVSGHTLDQSVESGMAELAPDVLGFKCYLISGMETFTAVDFFGLSRAAAAAAGLGRPLLLHAEDPSYIKSATEWYKKLPEKLGRSESWSDYVESRPAGSELTAVAGAAAYAGQVGARRWLHIVHVGTAEAAELLAFLCRSDQAGAAATCETCPQYLIFSSDDFYAKGAALKTAPPVKPSGNAEQLWRLLADGTIAFVASDHAPAPVAEKNTGSLWKDYGGIPGSGTLFPLVYSEGWRKGRLDLPAFLRVTSGAAARRYGLAGCKGELEPGKHADIVLVNPDIEHVVRGEELLSKGTITPFEGMKLAGKVVRTLVRGKTVWDAANAVDRAEDGILAAAGWGKQLRWGDK
ncbi:MAG: amidohydrolase family protein [Spirochaetes bacterium]|nr:amidohydrolase family protein [Spirochaetota bacterium]MBU0954283.1 amidohydrolase family protein [Spirochaetota bacterium]